MLNKRSFLVGGPSLKSPLRSGLAGEQPSDEDDPDDHGELQELHQHAAHPGAGG